MRGDKVYIEREQRAIRLSLTQTLSQRERGSSGVPILTHTKNKAV